MASTRGLHRREATARRSRTKTGLGLVALIAGLVVLLTGPAAGAAGQTIAFAPSGPFTGGESVQITGSGFSPNAPVAVQTCPTGRDVLGPGDCAPSATGGSVLVTADEAGDIAATLTVIAGPLGNQTSPAATCGPTASCDFVAINIANISEQVRVPIPYATPECAKPAPPGWANRPAGHGRSCAGKPVR